MHREFIFLYYFNHSFWSSVCSSSSAYLSGGAANSDELILRKTLVKLVRPLSKLYFHACFAIFLFTTTVVILKEPSCLSVNIILGLSHGNSHWKYMCRCGHIVRDAVLSARLTLTFTNAFLVSKFASIQEHEICAILTIIVLTFSVIICFGFLRWSIFCPTFH